MRFEADKTRKAWWVKGFDSRKLKHHMVGKVSLGIYLWESVPFFNLFVPFPKTPAGREPPCTGEIWGFGHWCLRSQVTEQETLGRIRGRKPEGCITIFKPLKRFLKNKNLFFTAPKDRECRPREADVNEILRRSPLLRVLSKERQVPGKQ